MKRSRSIQRLMMGGLLAFGLVASGCGMSTSHVALSLPNTEAPKAWTPIMTCATERGLKYIDASKEADPHVRISIDPNTQLDILFQVKGNHLEMELIIWGKTTDADREKILARLRKQGDEIWACAQQKMTATPAAATAPPESPAPPAATAATPPP